MTDRQFDLVLFGATGFTGGLVADYLATAAQTELRIGLAGRDVAAVQRLRDRLPARAQGWAVLSGDAGDPAGLARLAESTRLVLSTVGPYARLGLPLVTACVQAGTDYVDLAGEVPFLRACIDRYQEQAEQHRIRLVQTCGIIAAGVDLAVWDLARQASAAGEELTDVLGLYRQSSGTRSSGTAASTVEGLAAVRNDPTVRRLMGDPYALSPNRAEEPDLGRQSPRTGFDYDPQLGTWLGPFWYERLHGQVVRRTNALLDYPYGRQFRYREAVALGTGLESVVGRARTLAGIAWVPLALNPRIGPAVEAVVRWRAPAPRSGPAEGLDGGLVADLIGRTSAGRTIREHMEVPMGGYHATAVICSQMALALLQDADRLPARYGFLTPAAAGETILLERLRGQGFQIHPSNIQPLTEPPPMGVRTMALTEPKVDYLDHKGTPLAYIDQGTGPATVVAVPGIPGSTREFQRLAAALTADLRVVRVDLPGYGHSPRPQLAGMTIEQRADSVRALIAALDLAPVVLLGHSAGSQVVAHLSRHHPDLARCCALLAPPGPDAHYSLRFMRAAAHALQLPGARIVLDPVGRLAFAAQGLPTHLTDDERAHTVQDAAACNFAEYAEDLAGMNHPTLIAWACDDPAIPTDHFQAVAAVAPPGPRLVYVQGGHLIQDTHPQELGHAITDFVLQQGAR